MIKQEGERFLMQVKLPELSNLSFPHILERQPSRISPGVIYNLLCTPYHSCCPISSFCDLGDMPYSFHFSDEKIEAYRTRKWAKVSYASHQGWLTHGWAHLAIPPPGGWGLWNHSGSSSWPACFLFPVKGSNQQWPLKLWRAYSISWESY